MKIWYCCDTRSSPSPPPPVYLTLWVPYIYKAISLFPSSPYSPLNAFSAPPAPLPPLFTGILVLFSHPSSLTNPPFWLYLHLIMKSSFHYPPTSSLCPGVKEGLFLVSQVLCSVLSIICTLWKKKIQFGVLCSASRKSLAFAYQLDHLFFHSLRWQQHIAKEVNLSDLSGLINFHPDCSQEAFWGKDRHHFWLFSPAKRPAVNKLGNKRCIYMPKWRTKKACLKEPLHNAKSLFSS